MKRKLLFTALLLVATGSFLSTAQAFSVEAIPKVPWKVKEETLSNGLKVLLLRDSRAPVVTFMIWYRVGARNELPGRTGLAHLLEHMMFKGTQKYGAKMFSNIVQRNGGRHNAFTSQDYTAYFERIAAAQVEVAIELEADRMKNLLLDPKEFLLERNVVQEERRRRVDDQPNSLLWENLRGAAFQAHPYGHPVIGWETDIQRLTVEEAKDFYHTYYAPNNAFIVAVGDFQEEKILGQIRKHFGSIPRGPPPPPVTAREPTQKGERRIQVKRPARLLYFAAAFHVPTYKNDDSYALDVLGELLGGSRTARLDRIIQRKKQKVISIGARHPGISIDPDLFTVYAQLAPGVQVQDVEGDIWEQVEKLKHELPTATEMNRIKRRLAAEYVIRLDSQFYRAMSLGRSEIAGSWRWLDEYLPKIAMVTAEDVQRVAKKYLVVENRTVGILHPLLMESQRRRRMPDGSRGQEHIR